ncbi:MAG: NUDIX domain-containing protein [Chloroflexota bacterium]
MLKFFIKYIYTLSRMFWLWVNPLSVGVRILLIRDRQILLVNHVYNDLWYLPGGLLERRETFEDAARREALEEVGAQVKDLALFGVYTYHEKNNYDHVVAFISHDFDVSGDTDEEIERWGFFELDDLPDKISPGTRNRIQDYIDNETKRIGDW